MKTGHLALFALAPALSRCEPTRAPPPPGPAETTAPVVEPAATASMPGTTTTVAETTTTCAEEDGVTFTVLGYDCDDYQSTSGWVRMLAVQIGRSESADGMVVAVDGATQGAWEDWVWDTPNDVLMAWPATGSGRERTFATSFVLAIAIGDDVIYSDTFTEDRVAAEEPACLPLFNPPAG
jgi:hypothetical protein